MRKNFLNVISEMSRIEKKWNDGENAKENFCDELICDELSCNELIATNCTSAQKFCNLKRKIKEKEKIRVLFY